MKKLYVIVEYDIRDDNYLSYAVDGIVFENKKTAEEHMNIKANCIRKSAEELILYEYDKK